MAGDHGVVAEGVTAFPQVRTPQMVLNLLYGGAAVNVLACHAGARVTIVDLGVAAELPPNPYLRNRKIASGTANIARGPAMTAEMAQKCLQISIEIAQIEVDRGVDIIAAGDMGIVNSTPSAAIAASLSGHDPEQIVGRGTGVDDVGLQRKLTAVRQPSL